MLRKSVSVVCSPVSLINVVCDLFLGQRDPREIISFTFSILSNQSDCVQSEVLPSLFTRCFQYAMILGVEEDVTEDPSSIVTSLTNSVVCWH